MSENNLQAKLNKLSRDELNILSRKFNIKGYRRLTKDDLIKCLINQYQPRDIIKALSPGFWKRNKNFLVSLVIAIIVGGIYTALPYIYPPKINILQLKYDILNTLSKPSQQEVENEIDRQFKAEFAKKKKRALEKYQKGINAFNGNKFKIAIIHFEKAIEVLAIPSFYILRGVSYFYIKQFQKALSDCNKAIELKSDYAEAYNNRGIIWFYKRNYDNAISDYNKAIELNPDDAAFYNNRGASRRFKRNYDNAISDYNKAIELNPDYEAAYNNRGITWQYKNDYDKAIKDFNRAIELNPDSVAAYNSRGGMWFQKGDYYKALSDYDKAIELNPDYAEAYNNRGSTWGQKKNYDKAFKDINKAIELNPDYAEAYTITGELLGNLKAIMTKQLKILTGLLN